MRGDTGLQDGTRHVALEFPEKSWIPVERDVVNVSEALVGGIDVIAPEGRGGDGHVGSKAEALWQTEEKPVGHISMIPRRGDISAGQLELAVLLRGPGRGMPQTPTVERPSWWMGSPTSVSGRRCWKPRPRRLHATVPCSLERSRLKQRGRWKKSSLWDATWWRRFVVDFGVSSESLEDVLSWVRRCDFDV